MPDIRRFPNCFLLAAAVMSLLLTTSQTFAQDDDSADETREVAKPVITINLASVDTALKRADYLFSSIDRSEISDLISFKLSDVRDLKGINRELPAGEEARALAGHRHQCRLGEYAPEAAIGYHR